MAVTGTGFTGPAPSTSGRRRPLTPSARATPITATSPAAPAGTVDVTVTTPVGTSATSAADHFTYEAAPSVSAISPVAGPLSGGTTVTVTGTNLTGASGASFGSAAASAYTVASSTQLSATSPAAPAGTVDLTVTTPSGTSATSAADHFSYEAAPTVSALSPLAGPLSGGTTVAVTGTGFSGASAVDFGVYSATYTVISSTQISATSPAAPAGTVDLTVTTPSGTSATSAADHFSYEAGPSVSALSPLAGPLSGGTTVAVTGTGFSGASAVDFGVLAASAYTVASATQLSATSPAQAAGTVDLTVTTPSGTSATSAADQFSYEAGPSVSALSPLAGPLSGGTTVAVTGTNFTGASAVSFGSTGATSYTVSSATQLSATSPAGTGTVDLTVTTPSGVSATSAADQFSYEAAPSVSALSPVAGLPAGGTSVSVTGTDFTGASAVHFGAVVATTYTVISST